MKKETILNDQIKYLMNELENKKDDLDFCCEWLSTTNQNHTKRLEMYNKGELTENSYKMYELEFLVESQDILRKRNLIKNENEILEVEISIASIHGMEKIEDSSFESLDKLLSRKKQRLIAEKNKQYENETNKLLELTIGKLAFEEKEGKISARERVEKEEKIAKKLNTEIEKEITKDEKNKANTLKVEIPSVKNHSSR